MGKAQMFEDKPKPNQGKMKTNSVEAIIKSTKQANIAARGINSLGKYTFVTRRAFVTRLIPEKLREVAKNVQSTNAEYENTGYGIPSDGIFANRPKNSVNMSIVAKGCRIAQDAPRTVCL
jgi:hypothetical protein